MNSTKRNIWNKLSSSQKLNLIGSGLLLVSLFLNWYSDKDIFRSGDTYSALSGPLYLVGFSMMILAVGNILLSLSRLLHVPVWKTWTESRTGKWQITVGLASMYLLLVINSAYFDPKFGLNILNKRSEIGAMLALVATVMISIGGYLAFRHRLESEQKEDKPVASAEEMAPIPVEEKPERTHQSVEKPVAIIAQEKTPIESAVQVQTEAAVQSTAVINQATFSERDPRGKTEYERTKLYENLRKTMIRDTMTPQQRKKERAKEVQNNAFSANFGKGEKVTAPKLANSNTNVEDLLKKAQDSKPAAATTSAKKPQMYRMDL